MVYSVNTVTVHRLKLEMGHSHSCPLSFPTSRDERKTVNGIYDFQNGIFYVVNPIIEPFNVI